VITGRRVASSETGTAIDRNGDALDNPYRTHSRSYVEWGAMSQLRCSVN